MSFMLRSEGFFFSPPSSAAAAKNQSRCSGRPECPEEDEPLIRVDEHDADPPEEDPDYNKKSGPGAGGGYVVLPQPDQVTLTPDAQKAAQEKKKP